MTVNDLGIQERAALLALMAEAREVPNPELAELTGFSLVGAARRKLNERDLVSTRKEGRAFVHELTDKGWRWCADELGGPCPPNARSAGGALYAVLAGLRRYLDRSDLTLADLFGPGPVSSATPGTGAATAPPAADAAADVGVQIRAAYRSIAHNPGAWVSLSDLRAGLATVAATDVDAALREMSRVRVANLVPQANQKVLSQSERDAAVRIGGEDCHLISIEGA